MKFRTASPWEKTSAPASARNGPKGIVSSFLTYRCQRAKGNAGKGALIGAGTSVIGGALLDAITAPPQPRRVYVAPPPPQPMQQGYTTQAPQASYEDTSGAPGTRKKVVRKYDDSGKVVSEEEIYY